MSAQRDGRRAAFITARGAPPPLARALGRRFASLPSGPSRGPQALCRVARLEPMACFLVTRDRCLNAKVCAARDPAAATTKRLPLPQA